MTYGHLPADCLYTRISSGPNAGYRVWDSLYLYLQITTRERAIMRAGRDRPSPAVDIGLFKATQLRQHRYGADADWSVLDGVHISATWQTRLNRLCDVAMRFYVKLFTNIIYFIISATAQNASACMATIKTGWGVQVLHLPSLTLSVTLTLILFPICQRTRCQIT